MRGKTAREIRKLIDYPIGDARRNKQYMEAKIGEKMGKMLRINEDKTTEIVDRMIPLMCIVRTESEHRLYKTMKKLYKKFDETKSEIQSDIKGGK